MRLIDLFRKKESEKASKDDCCSVCGNRLKPEGVFCYGKNKEKCCESCYRKADLLSQEKTNSQSVQTNMPNVQSEDDSKSRESIQYWSYSEPTLRSLSTIQEIYSRYDTLLTEFLINQGIPAKGGSLEGINDRGKPDGYRGREERDHEMIRLRQNESAAITFHIAGGWFAIPSAGSCLRYIIPSTDDRLMDFMGSVNGVILAAATDDKDVWILTDNGNVISSDQTWGVQADTQEKAPVFLFDKKDKIHELTMKYFTEDRIEKIIKQMLNLGGVVRINDNLGSCDYDTEEKVFFGVRTDGDYYHGYDVSYPVLKKENIISRMINHASLLTVELGCLQGKLPLIELIGRLEDSGKLDYRPPYNYGDGVDYI